MTLMTHPDYQPFLSKVTAKQWDRIGTQRRAGVATPLFSLHSKQSIGIGEIPDLKHLVDWFQLTGMSILQLLPMNDVGFEFRPYDAQSTFALDPMYLALRELKEIDLKPWMKELEDLKKRFPTSGLQVNYEVKGAKLGLLWEIFKTRDPASQAFEAFKSAQGQWLQDYVLYRVIKEMHQEAGWKNWPSEFAGRQTEALDRIKQERVENLEFQRWLQWQLFAQFSDLKKYAQEKEVFLMGDLPFLVSGDSADVWAAQNYFKLDLSSGAPPDLYISKGQRWGMPPYRWDEIRKDGFGYLQKKLQYAAEFYDFFRIDHVVGVFRLWTIAESEPLESGGMHGRFDPENEAEWENHGREILQQMIQSSPMLPCAEDLGIIPNCCFSVLEDFGICGMDVQRWAKDWGNSYDFKPTEQYRKNSIAVISTHDMSSFKGWWLFEADTVDQGLFERKCRERGFDLERLKQQLFDLDGSTHGRLRWKKVISEPAKLLEVLQHPEHEVADFVDLYKGSYGEKERFLHHIGAVEERDASAGKLVALALQKASQTSSIFSVQLLQDVLTIDDFLDQDAWQFRINFPGTSSDQNWTLRLPFALEEFQAFPMNGALKRMHEKAERI